MCHKDNCALPLAPHLWWPALALHFHILYWLNWSLVELLSKKLLENEGSVCLSINTAFHERRKPCSGQCYKACFRKVRIYNISTNCSCLRWTTIKAKFARVFWGIKQTNKKHVKLADIDSYMAKKQLRTKKTKLFCSSTYISNEEK